MQKPTGIRLLILSLKLENFKKAYSVIPFVGTNLW